MSKQGIQIAADIFNEMQKAREKLMRLACAKSPLAPDAKVDLLLAHLMTTGNDAMKNDFMAIISDPIQWDKIKG